MRGVEPAVIIRPATMADLDVLLDIRAEIAGEGIWIGAELPLDIAGDRARFTATIEGSSVTCMLVVECDGVVVGNLSLEERAGIAHLGMCLLDTYRGLGLGRALLDAGIERARASGAHKIDLEHWPWNHAGRRLYERAGFIEEGYRRRQWRRKDGSLWDSVLMGLVLDEDAPGHDERAVEPPR